MLCFQNNCSARNPAASPTEPDLPVTLLAQAAQREEDCPTAPYRGNRPLEANSYGSTHNDLAQETIAGGGGSNRGNNDNQVPPRVAAAGASALVAVAAAAAAAAASTAAFSCLFLTLLPNRHCS